MKITKKRLIEIIKEELVNESPEGRAQMHAKGLSKKQKDTKPPISGIIDKQIFSIKWKIERVS